MRCLRCLSTFIHRALGVVLGSLPLADTIRVYELSSRGALVAYLRRRFPDLTCSEYFDEVPPGAFKGTIQCQDVQRLTYDSDVFDLVTSTEVFEHVPNDQQGFREIYRVLKPGGYFAFTVPLLGNAVTVERAVLQDGRVVHVLPPEYHGDRIRGLGRVLAFRNYGTDIGARLEAAGFSAAIRDVSEPRHAIRHMKVVVARKPSAV
ncbi:MAG: class I SAM-dependent methyltransferase [Nitrospirota bacterium]